MMIESLIVFVFGFICGMAVGATVAGVSFYLASNGTAITSLPSSTADNTENLTSNPYSGNITEIKHEAMWPINPGPTGSEKNTLD